MRNWKLTFIRVENQAGMLLFILAPLWAAIASWQVSPWLAPLAAVVVFQAAKYAVWGIDILISDLFFESHDEFNRLTQQVEQEFWGDI